MLQRLTTTACQGQGTELQQKAAMWDTAQVPGGQQPARWGKPGHRWRGHGMGRCWVGWGRHRDAVALLRLGCNLPPQKGGVWRGPSLLPGAQKLVTTLLAPVTQERVPPPQGNDPRRGVLGGGPEVGFGLQLFFLVVAKFYILHVTFPTHQQTGSGQCVAGPLPCLCMPPVSMLHHLQLPASFSDHFSISAGE